MAIPGPDVITSVPQKRTFESMVGIANNSKFQDFELGGIGLYNPTQGLQVQVWRAYIANGRKHIYINAPNTSDTLVYTAANYGTLSEVSLAFDQNMHPMIAFVENGVSKYNWFDSVSQTQITSSLASDCLSPRVSLDDKSLFAEASSDIILAYIKNGNLYRRQQRDRYTVEVLLKTGIPAGYYLHKIGMNRGRRMQFEFRSYWDIYSTMQDFLASAADPATNQSAPSITSGAASFDLSQTTQWKPGD